MEDTLKDLKTNMIACGNYLNEITGVPKDRIHFEPPGTQQLKYPCIIFELNTMPSIKSDNTVIFTGYKYNIIYITKDNCDIVIDKLNKCELAYYNGEYVSDNLYNFRYVLNGNLV